MLRPQPQTTTTPTRKPTRTQVQLVGDPRRRARRVTCANAWRRLTSNSTTRPTCQPQHNTSTKPLTILNRLTNRNRLRLVYLRSHNKTSRQLSNQRRKAARRHSNSKRRKVSKWLSLRPNGKPRTRSSCRCKQSS